MTLELSSERPAAAVAVSDQPHPLRWWWLAGALVGVVAVGVAGTAVNPGLPLLAGELELSVGSQLRWVAGAMALGVVVLVVPGAPIAGTVAIGAGVNGVGLAMAVVAFLHGDPASRVPSTPAAVFAALALGSPAGSLLVEALTPSGTFPPPGTPADGFGALRDATSAVLVWSIGLLAAAVVIAVVLGLRSGARAERPGSSQ